MSKKLYTLGIAFAVAVSLFLVNVNDTRISAQSPDAPQTTPTLAPPTIVAELIGPTVTRGTFFVSLEYSKSARNDFSHCVYPIDKGTGKEFVPHRFEMQETATAKRELWIFQDPPNGAYLIRWRAQVANKEGDGFDPLLDVEHGTLVNDGAPQPNEPGQPNEPEQPPVTPSKVTAIVYVFEKDKGTVPLPVLAGLNKVNLVGKIIATNIDQNADDGTGSIPAQYQAPIAYAQKKGLPELVRMSGDAVLDSRDVTTEQQVIEAAQ